MGCSFWAVRRCSSKGDQSLMVRFDISHMSKVCPKKKNKPKPSQIQTVEVKATQNEEPNEDNKTNILSRVRKLSKEDRTAIFNEMLKAEGF
jgi:hypothetical protein